MSAERLRAAAASMRERAGAASEHATPPWRQYGMAGVTSQGGPEPVGEYPVECDCCNERVGLTGCLDMATAAHIASWHPAVALAVADLLDKEAADGQQLTEILADLRERPVNWRYGSLGAALAVADAYLGGAS